MYPEIFLTTAICVLLVYGAFAPKISTISHERKTRSIINNNLFFNISWLGIFSLAITLFLLPTVNGASVTIFNDLLIVDDLTTIVKKNSYFGSCGGTEMCVQFNTDIYENISMKTNETGVNPTSGVTFISSVATLWITIFS